VSTAGALACGITGLSLVVPLLNEEPNVDPLVAEIAALQAELAIETELILVDDGSTDGTREALERNRRAHRDLRILAFPTRRGQSAAIAVGVRAARHPYVATLDGDLQNDVRDVPRMLALCDRCDVVIGRRTERHDSASRRVAALVANRVRRQLLDDGAMDSGCSLKLFPRARFLELTMFDGMHRFLPALFRAQGANLCEIEVHHRERRAGVSKYGNFRRLLRSVPDLLGMLWLRWRRLDLSGLLEDP
jgi:dolichol-phosphate mannosyltransferase